MAGRTKRFDFEKALKELEQLVVHMEEGQVPLEESIKQFERASALAKQCEEALQAAEEKIEVLTSGGVKLLKDIDNQETTEKNTDVDSRDD